MKIHGFTRLWSLCLNRNYFNASWFYVIMNIKDLTTFITILASSCWFEPTGSCRPRVAFLDLNPPLLFSSSSFRFLRQFCMQIHFFNPPVKWIISLNGWWVDTDFVKPFLKSVFLKLLWILITAENYPDTRRIYRNISLLRMYANGLWTYDLTYRNHYFLDPPTEIDYCRRIKWSPKPRQDVDPGYSE